MLWFKTCYLVCSHFLPNGLWNSVAPCSQKTKTGAANAIHGNIQLYENGKIAIPLAKSTHFFPWLIPPAHLQQPPSLIPVISGSHPIPIQHGDGLEVQLRDLCTAAHLHAPGPELGHPTAMGHGSVVAWCGLEMMIHAMKQVENTKCGCCFFIVF